MARTIVMPSAEDISKAWDEAIGRVPAKYLDRAEKTVGFKERALAGEDTYRAVMEAVIREMRRKKGLELITDEDWKKGIRDKGAKRIGDGMRLAAGKRRTKYEPFRAALHGLEIPERGADAIENARVIVPKVVEALVKKKKEILGI